MANFSDEMDSDELQSIIEDILAMGRPSERARDFLDSLLERAEKYDTVYLSDKQIEWLEDLADDAGIR